MQIHSRPGLHQQAGAFPFEDPTMNPTMNQASSHKRPTNQAAFSLIELVIVVAIIGVIAAIAVPRFADAAAGRQLIASKNQLLLDIETAKLRARATSTTHTLKFFPTKNSYVIAEGNTVDRDSIIIARNFETDPFYSRIIDTDLGGDEVISITVFGDCTPPAVVRIRSVNRRLDITIEGIDDAGINPTVILTTGEVKDVAESLKGAFGS